MHQAPRPRLPPPPPIEPKKKVWDLNGRSEALDADHPDRDPPAPAWFFRILKISSRAYPKSFLNSPISPPTHFGPFGFLGGGVSLLKPCCVPG